MVTAVRPAARFRPDACDCGWEPPKTYATRKEARELEQRHAQQHLPPDAPRKCTRCGKVLPVSAFSERHYPNGKTTYRPRCKACEAELTDERRKRSEHGGTE